LAFIFLILLIGSFIQGTSGFGFGLFAMSTLPLLFSLKESTLLVLSLTVIVSLTIVSKVYKHIQWKGLLVVLSAALIGRIGSFFFLNAFGDMDFLKQWLGLFLIAMVALMIVNKRKTRPADIVMHPVFPVILGFIGGFVGGAFAVGGPFFVFYFLMLYKEKHHFHANLQVTFFVTGLFTLILHGSHGDFNSAHLIYYVVGAVSVFLGSKLGHLCFEKLSRDRIEKAAMLFVFVAGLNLILFQG